MKKIDLKNIFKKKDSSGTTHTMSVTRLLKFGDPHGSIFKQRDKQPNFYIGVLLNTIKVLVLSVFMIGVIAFGAVWGIAKAYLETTPTLKHRGNRKSGGDHLSL